MVLGLLCGAPAAIGATASIPSGWPATDLLLGVRDPEGGAQALRRYPRLGLRYHYLSGGANTGKGWQSWARGEGSFVPGYIQDSHDHGLLPLLSVYQLRESLPGRDDADEPSAFRRNLASTGTMKAWFADLKVALQRAGSSGRAAILHVEPDMWGHLQRFGTGDDATTTPVRVAATGLDELAGLPDDAAGLAQAVSRLRNRYAPKVKLGFHLSVWGTNKDPAYDDPSDAEIDALAARSARFYKSLGARFDVIVAEFADRDAGLRQVVDGDEGRSFWTAADFDRHARYLAGVATETGKRIVLWQVPVGTMQLPNVRGRYKDNRVEMLLGTGVASRARLRRYVDAGVIAILFGHAITGATCACDADGDGKDDDGGQLRRLVAHNGKHRLRLPGAARRPGTTARRTAPPRLRITGRATSVVRRGQQVHVSVRVVSAHVARTTVALHLYAPSAQSYTAQRAFRGVRLRPGVPRTFRASFRIPRGGRTGGWRVATGVFDADWKRLFRWSAGTAAFRVR